MKVNKEIRKMSRGLLRASFTDSQLDRGKIGSLVDSLIAKKPRHYLDILSNYKRLLRLEVEKRQAHIESATELAPDVGARIVENLKRKYGQDVTAEFSINPELLGGMKIRVGSNVWDGTVRQRLERLQQQL
jgi:F-type H+-transporting ATPase subunit delta